MCKTTFRAMIAETEFSIVLIYVILCKYPIFNMSVMFIARIIHGLTRRAKDYHIGLGPSALYIYGGIAWLM